MPPRDYESAPVTERLDLDAVIRGLSRDLEDMRANRITPHEGLARAAVAKQLFNGVRLYLQAMSVMEKSARPVESLPPAGKAQS